MAFTELSLTRSGQTLWAKYQQGKGLHITRIGIGDGRLGESTLYNATALISERMSLPVDAVILNADSTQAAIITTLDNKDVVEGFSFRELAVFAKDPDTSQEVVYLNDNAGEDAETIPPGTGPVKVYERLKLLVKADSASSITFEGSGNPLNLAIDDIDDAAISASSLWSSDKINRQLQSKADLDPVTHKVVDSQLPSMDYAPTGHGHTWGEITDKPESFTPSGHAATHGAGGSDPISPADIGAEAAGAADELRVELTPRVDELVSKVSTLWSAIFEDLTTNPFAVGFADLTGVTVTSGIWNAVLQRLEC